MYVHRLGFQIADSLASLASFLHQASILVSSSTRRPSSFPPRSITSSSSPSSSSLLLRFNSTTSTTESTPPLDQDTSLPSSSETEPSTSPPPSPLPFSNYPTYASAVVASVSFHTRSPPPSPEEYNTLLWALTRWDQASGPPPLSSAISFYHRMLDLGIQPAQSSIGRLILLLCTHDTLLNKMYNPQVSKPVDSKVKGKIAVSDKKELAFSSAVALFRAELPRHLERKPVTFLAMIYEVLLKSAVLHRDPQTAREIYLEMDKQSQAEEEEGRKNVKISVAAVTSLIKAFAFTNSAAVKVVLQAFRGKERDGLLRAE